MESDQASSSSSNLATEAAISLRAIRKRFGYRDVLAGIRLDIEAGECLAIFGHNGAGKSTLMRIIATQWKPSAGEGCVFGHDLVQETSAIRGKIGVVMHQSFLRQELTLEENLSFFGSLYGIQQSAESLQSRSEHFGLGHRLQDPVSTFSQGMIKRANLIRSRLHDPRLWILDEPFSGLDPQGQDILREAIGDFRAGGGTVLLVTHRLEIGEELADRIITLEDGKLVSDRRAIDRRAGEAAS